LTFQKKEENWCLSPSKNIFDNGEEKGLLEFVQLNGTMIEDED
jgi:hypothetical protein